MPANNIQRTRRLPGLSCRKILYAPECYIHLSRTEHPKSQLGLRELPYPFSAPGLCWEASRKLNPGDRRGPSLQMKGKQRFLDQNFILIRHLLNFLPHSSSYGSALFLFHLPSPTCLPPTVRRIDAAKRTRILSPHTTLSPTPVPALPLPQGTAEGFLLPSPPTGMRERTV